jgi:hypothetical protein
MIEQRARKAQAKKDNGVLLDRIASNPLYAILQASVDQYFSAE